MNVNDRSIDPSQRLLEDTETEQIKNPASVKTALPVDLQVYEGIDVLTNIVASLQQFTDKTNYMAALQYPILPSPSENNADDLQPYDVSEQMVIRKNFSEKLLTLLAEDSIPTEDAIIIYEAVLSGNTIKDPKLAKIADKLGTQITAEIQKLAGLPSQWTIQSTDSIQWTPIASSTVDPTTGILNPQAIAQARMEMLLMNVEEIYTEFQIVATKLMDELPAENRSRYSLGDFAKIIGQAIQNLKEALAEMQIKDAEKQKELTTAKSDLTQVRANELHAKIEKRQEMARQIEANEKKQKILGILGPALSGLGTVVGIALAAFTAGASLGLIIAMSIVGSALTAYSIVDSQLGLTQSAVAALNDYLLEEFPGDDNVLARAGVKAAIISAIAVPLAIAFVASGGGAAVNVATQTATMVAKEAALQAIRQASMQLLLLTIMSSNAIPDLMMGSLIQSGAIDKDDEKAKFITQIICMIVVMGITMYGATNLSRASTAAKPAVPPPPTVPKPVIAPPIAAAPTVVVAKTASERLSLLIDKILAALAKAAEKAGNVAVETAKSGKETIQSFLETFKRMPDPKELPHSITAMVQAAGVSVQAVDGFYRGVLGLKLAELTKELGDLQQSEELIQALIKSLEDILKGMEGSLDARGRTMSSLQQDFNALFRANDEIVEKMYRG